MSDDTHGREVWDRRRRDALTDDVHEIREILEDVRTQVRIVNGRVSRAEDTIQQHGQILYGSATDLSGDSGIVGMLRQLKRGQQVTIWLLTGVAVPAALTVLGTYLPMLLQ